MQFQISAALLVALRNIQIKYKYIYLKKVLIINIMYKNQNSLAIKLLFE